jgi:CheY-like chemotaxis protein
MRSEPPSGKNILVVEDDTLMSGAIRMVLEWEGHHVTCAENGREALELLRSTDLPDLILLDLLLPVLDGRQFLSEQEQDPSLRSIPVVVVSGVPSAASLETAGHLLKPFQPEELLELIRRQPAGGLPTAEPEGQPENGAG